MVYSIMGRADASQATRIPDDPVTAIISVTDTGSERNSFYPAKWITDILELQFLDVEQERNGGITREQAAMIADFVFKVRKKVDRFIVHCEYGQSRSAGIAAAISQYLERHDSGIFVNRRYHPNRTCYHYVLDALRQRGSAIRRMLR
jgi:predicted protein tyrosine phosphatase